MGVSSVAEGSEDNEETLMPPYTLECVRAALRNTREATTRDERKKIALAAFEWIPLGLENPDPEIRRLAESLFFQFIYTGSGNSCSSD